MQNPPTVFARQANIANGPQQINNGLPPETVARASENQSRPNKLLEAHGERMDAGATSTPNDCDQELATMGAIDRAAKPRR